VRVPSSYCGLWGIRTTHGRMPMRGARALAPSFSTAGLLARDAALLQRAGRALLAGCSGSAAPALPAQPRLIVARDAFELALPDGRAALEASLSSSALVTAVGRPATEVVLGEGVAVGGGKVGLEAWFDVMRIIQVRLWFAVATHDRYGVNLGAGIRVGICCQVQLDWSTRDYWEIGSNQSVTTPLTFDHHAPPQPHPTKGL